MRSPFCYFISLACPVFRPHYKLHDEGRLKRHGCHYLLLNYEKFQGRQSKRLVEHLLAYSLDFIVLDEVHFAKQRNAHVSQRRKALLTLVKGIAAHNAALRVLAMSATPIINNLTEAKALLELVTGQAFPDLNTKATVNNALAMHRKLMRCGLRSRPRNDLFPLLQQAQQSILQVEQTLLPAKLEVIHPHVQKGTLVYTHYVQDMIVPIQQRLRSMGYTVGLYSGDEKSGVDDFLKGNVDILLASRPILIGMDGLQKVCDRAIILSLPWTGAEYEQLLGRLHRQGSAFGAIKVIIPQVLLVNEENETWSWDQTRWSHIHYKRTLSDCAVDGSIPETVRLSEQAILQKSRQVLEEWITRIQHEESKDTCYASA